jgi:hypothetical protein
MSPKVLEWLKMWEECRLHISLAREAIKSNIPYHSTCSDVDKLLEAAMKKVLHDKEMLMIHEASKDT